MKIRNWLVSFVLFASVLYATQYLFIAYLPNILYVIAKYRSGKPLNTVIAAPKTDAHLRKVVLPNPDFIYSACFFDATDKDVLITGEFPDSTQYSSLAFYGSSVQPFYVMNNQRGMKSRFKLRLSSVHRVNCDIRTTSKQGVVLFRILSTNEQQNQKALNCQKSFKIIELDQNE